MSVDLTQNQAISQDAPKENSKEVNLRQIARQLDEERQARMSLEAELKKEREEKVRKPYKDHDDEDDHSDEPYIDKRSLKKELSRFASEFEQKVDRKAEEKARSMIEQERQSTFLRANPDFKEVLSPDVIQKFAEKHPEQAEALLEMPDNFARQKLLYQNIKALGVNRPAVAEKTIQQRIDENRRSPYYQPSGGATPPYASTGDFSEGGRKNAYSKMQDLIKGRRGV